MANISLKALRLILSDCMSQSTEITRVGLVGSYARGDYSLDSDIDLLYQAKSEKPTDEDIFLKIQSILMNQFRKRLDVINYDTVIKNLQEPKSLTHVEYAGYRQMLRDLKWIWETEK